MSLKSNTMIWKDFSRKELPTINTMHTVLIACVTSQLTLRWNMVSLSVRHVQGGIARFSLMENTTLKKSILSTGTQPNSGFYQSQAMKNGLNCCNSIVWNNRELHSNTRVLLQNGTRRALLTEPMECLTMHLSQHRLIIRLRMQTTLIGTSKKQARE